MLPVVKRLPSIFKNSVLPNRNFYGMVGPPRQPISVAETWGHGFFIVLGIFATPVWVLTHIKEYRGLDKKGEEEE